jgi:YspA, cpYpsA-related SLOG family
MRRVIVTGSRRWGDDTAVYDALWTVYHADVGGPFHLMHGACATGADAYADHWDAVAGRYLGCTIERFRADWTRRGRAAGPERNRRMITAGADLVLAFPVPEGIGTQQTMRLAEEAGIEVRVIKHG